MIVFALGSLWGTYALGFWGYSLIRGFNLGPSQIFSPFSFYTGSWPPSKAGNTVIIPDGTQASLTVYTTSATTSPTTNSTTSPTSSGGGTAPAPPSQISNSASIQQVAATAGWGSGSQWNCLQTVIADESGGNPLAANSSGAFGIAQALGHGTAGSAGCGRNAYGAQYGLSDSQAQQANCGNAWYQMIWMIGYIKDRYGNPCGAAQHEATNHWY